MNIIMYRFRPIVIVEGLILQRIPSPMIFWGSCPMAVSVVDHNVWFFTTAETVPDRFYIQEYEGIDEDTGFRKWRNIFTQKSILRWSEPEIAAKTFFDGQRYITISVLWLSASFIDIYIFYDETLKWRIVTDEEYEGDFANESLYLADSHIFHLLVKDGPFLYNLRSADYGQTWTRYLVDSDARVYRTIGGYDNYVFVLSDRKLYRSTDNGITWSYVSDVAAFDYAVMAGSNNILCIATQHADNANFGVFVSTNHGETFDFIEIETRARWPVWQMIVENEKFYLSLIHSAQDIGKTGMRLLFLESENGRDWQEVSESCLPNLYYNDPAFLAKEGDVVAFVTYYLESSWAGYLTAMKMALISFDGGKTWDATQSNFVELSLLPDSYIRIKWPFKEGQVEIYRRSIAAGMAGQWYLIDTLSAAQQHYIDVKSSGNIKYEYYVQSVGNGKTQIASIHADIAYLRYEISYLHLFNGSIFIGATLYGVSLIPYADDWILYPTVIEKHPVTPEGVMFCKDMTPLKRYIFNSFDGFCVAHISIDPLIIAVNRKSGINVFWDGEYESFIDSRAMLNNSVPIFAQHNGYAIFFAKYNLFLAQYRTTNYGRDWEVISFPIEIEYRIFNVEKKDDTFYIAAKDISWADILCMVRNDICRFILHTKELRVAVNTNADNVYFLFKDGNNKDYLLELIQNPTNQIGCYIIYSVATTRMCHYIYASPTFSQDTTLFMSDSTGSLFKSTDGGLTWNLVLSEFAHTFGWDANYHNTKTAYTLNANTGNLYRTTDGSTWTKVSTQHYGGKVVVSPNVSNDNTLFVCYNSSKRVYKSTDGGTTFFPSNDGITDYPTNIAIAAEYTTIQTLFVVNNSGYIFRSTNGGATWTQLAKVSSYLNSVHISPNYSYDQTVFCTDPWNIYKSTDSGITWTTIKNIPTGLDDFMISKNYHLDKQLFYATPSFAYRSIDDGITWNIIALSQHSFYDMAFGDSENIFLVTGRYVLKSSSDFSFRLIKQFGVMSSQVIVDIDAYSQYVNIAFKEGNYLYMLHSDDNGETFTTTKMSIVSARCESTFSREGSHVVLGGDLYVITDATLDEPNYIQPHYLESFDNGATWHAVFINYIGNTEDAKYFEYLVTAGYLYT